jgi:hypothetical protein
VAALFVEETGAYAGLELFEGVEIWSESRDARTYPGPFPVVAHPPCTRWCMLAGLVEARYGHKRGEDGGCFASALASVRTWGGVLEHPAWSRAWPAYGLQPPSKHGGWTGQDEHGGWTCSIEQGAYGHAARKATWLYAVGTARPDLRWGPATGARAMVSWCANHSDDTRPRVGKRAAAATPIEFRDLLIGLARSCHSTGSEVDSRGEA